MSRPATGTQSTLGQFICHPERRHPLALRQFKNREHAVVDSLNLEQRVCLPPTEEFSASIDNATRVGNVVRGIENTDFMKRVTVAVFKELIVRGARYYSYLEPRYCLVVDNSAECAGGENIRPGVKYLRRRNSFSLKLIDDSLHS